MGSIEISYENEDGEEVTVDLPSKKCVCPECEGEGAVLRDGLRGVAFTQSDMEDWDDDFRREYFTKGLEKTGPNSPKVPKSRFDQVCPECHGDRVIDEVDENNLSEDEKVHFDAWQESENLKHEYDRAFAAESRMERMMGC